MKVNIKSICWGIVGGVIPVGILMLVLFNNQDNSMLVKNNLKVPPASNVGLFSMAGIDSNMNFVEASESSIKSVVHVKTEIVRTVVKRNPFFEFFYGPGAGEQYKQFGRGSGSGVIISKDGYIVTNNHVIENASKIEVTLFDNTTYEARVIGTDPSTDIAVLKIDAEQLRPMPVGNSEGIRVGQWVLAVGNPFNLTSTVTAGIVSAKARNIHIIGRETRGTGIIPIESFIQTDAAVNPGNSGGALINIKGELVGINTAIASQTGSYSGYSFAIPSNLAIKVVKDIIEFGRVQRAFLGVTIQNINQQLIDEKELDNSNGVYIAGIREDSGAEDAKLKEGDVILKVEGKEVNSVAALQREIGTKRPGDIVNLTIKRNEKELNKKVVLTNKNGKTDLVSKKEIKSHSALGATFSELSKNEMKELNISNGVKITDISAGKLRSVGLTTGTVITKINNSDVTSVEQLVVILKNDTDQKQGVLLEIITPGGEKGYVGFGL